MNDHEHAIRERAYALWEKEGRPHGRDQEFWERARSMIASEARAPVDTPLQQRSSGDAGQDAALADTFPASDPPAMAQPKKVARRSRAVR